MSITHWTKRILADESGRLVPGENQIINRAVEKAFRDAARADARAFAARWSIIGTVAVEGIETAEEFSRKGYVELSPANIGDRRVQAAWIRVGLYNAGYATGVWIGDKLSQFPGGDEVVYPEGWNDWTEYYPGGIPPDEFPHNGLEGDAIAEWYFTPNVGPVYGVTPPPGPPDYYTVPQSGWTVVEVWDEYFSPHYADVRGRSMRARSWDPGAGTVQDPQVVTVPGGLMFSPPGDPFDINAPPAFKAGVGTPLALPGEFADDAPATARRPLRGAQQPATQISIIPGVGRGPPVTVPHELSPPPRNTRERKTRANISGHSRLGWLLNTVTEGDDFITALWNALPEKYRTGYEFGWVKSKKGNWYKTWKQKGGSSGPKSQFDPLKRSGGNPNIATPAEKLADLYRHYDKIDVAKAIKNVAFNQAQDYVIGKIGSKAQKAARPWLDLLRRPVGFGTGPAM